MSKKIAIQIGALLLVAFGIFVLCGVVSIFIPRHGTAAHVSDLQTVCAKAGPGFTSTFTNSFVQKFPFDGPIDWKLIFFKDTALFLSGRVDTNKLEQFIISQPDTKFDWSGVDNAFEEGWPSAKDYPTTTWTNIWFRKEWKFEGYPMSIEGTVDIQSDSVTFRIW
jgi:hypothetical protein